MVHLAATEVNFLRRRFDHLGRECHGRRERSRVLN
jgi:hypothetical protein